MPKKIEIKGHKYGRLTVLTDSQPGKDKRLFVECECECGNRKLIRVSSLRTGNTRSCGCLRQSKPASKQD